MAIPKELEPLIDAFTADEKQLFDNLMTKQYTTAKSKDPNAPTLQEGWLRQQEFDKNSNEWKQRLTKAEKLAQDRMDWFNENKPIHDAALEHSRQMEARAQELEQQQTELRQRLTEAEARRSAEGGETVDWAELDRRVEEQAKKMGWVSKSELQQLAKEESAQMAREAARDEATKAITAAKTELWERSFPEIANHAADISEVVYDHKAEFGESLDRTAFSTFMKDNGITDFKKGYDQYVKPRREERDFKKRVDDEVQTRISGMTVNGGLPVPGGPQPKGALQMRLEKDAATPTSSTVAAMAAAQELRQEGRF